MQKDTRPRRGRFQGIGFEKLWHELCFLWGRGRLGMTEEQGYRRDAAAVSGAAASASLSSALADSRALPVASLPEIRAAFEEETPVCACTLSLSTRGSKELSHADRSIIAELRRLRDAYGGKGWKFINAALCSKSARRPASSPLRS